MSANRDPKHPSTFIYSSLYEIYQKGTRGTPEGALLTGKVLKSNDPRWVAPAESKALTDWAENTPSEHSLDASKKSLAKTLHELRNARKKLNFMISEMDELIKRTS
jgi:hypothetical protein